MKNLKNPINIYQKSKKAFFKNKRMFILLGLITTVLLASLYFIMDKKPKSYEAYFKNIENTMVMDEYSSAVSGAYQGLENQIGEEAYEALVLGVPVQEGSEFYSTQQDNFKALKNESDHIRAMVSEHEQQISELGGIVGVQDLEKVDNGNYKDPLLRAKVKNQEQEYFNSLKNHPDGSIYENRFNAAYQ